MERAIRLTGSPRLLVAVLLIVVVAALYFARDLLIPVSLASLLCFVLAPVATALEHRVGRVASVVVVVACACCVLGGTSYMVVAQVNELAAQLPTYRENIQAKIESLRGGALEMATVALGELENELQDPRVTEPPTGARQVATDATGASTLPSVQLVAPRASPLMGMLSAFAPMLKPLGTGGVVIVLMTFLLLERRS
ncbi:MAG: AI-2E family transporter, partial [Planctomycetota bacterium]